MATRHVTVRLDADVVGRLDARSHSTGRKRPELITRYVDEGMRMEDHPGIVFRSGPAGRRAALAAGPDVWEVIRVVRNVEGSGEAAVTQATAPGRPGVKLLIDERWPATLAEELRRRGHDAVAVVEQPGLAHRGDDVILDHAAKEGQVVFTENVPDFVPLATSVLSTGGTFPGLLLTSNAAWPRGNPTTLGRVVRPLDAFLSAHPSDTALQGRIEWLPQA